MSEFQRPVRPDEIVVAAQQLKVRFQTLRASRVAERAATAPTLPRELAGIGIAPHPSKNLD